jgi:hypothetical protein
MLSKVFVKNNKINFSILLFLLFFAFLHYLKPSLIYNREGGFRPFGLGYKNKTVLPMWVFAIVLSIFSYLAVSSYLLFW